MDCGGGEAFSVAGHLPQKTAVEFQSEWPTVSNQKGLQTFKKITILVRHEAVQSSTRMLFGCIPKVADNQGRRRVRM
jgi:hypothetical protein